MTQHFDKMMREYAKRPPSMMAKPADGGSIKRAEYPINNHTARQIPTDGEGNRCRAVCLCNQDGMQKLDFPERAT